MNLSDLPKEIISNFKINRFPKTNNRSLLAWSKADEFMVWLLKSNDLLDKSISIYNDSFGYLSCHLLSDKTEIKIDSKSQEKAITQNLEANGLEFNANQFVSLQANPSKETCAIAEVVVLRIPKSLDLFEQYLSQISSNVTKDSVVICSFMTKYFTKGMIELAGKYFEIVEQTKAWKKSRLIVLSKPKTIEVKPLLNEINSDFGVFKQYFGVFSAKNIDYATQFLIQNIELPEETNCVLDLASGNGVLAKQVQSIKPNVEIHLVDDSFLAVESSKLNISGDNVHFHFNDELSEFGYGFFDYIISNPPFHIGHEIDISLPLSLFKQAGKSLKPNGAFQLVFNNHLNYATQLTKFFKEVKETAKNDKFTVLTCRKPV